MEDIDHKASEINAAVRGMKCPDCGGAVEGGGLYIEPYWEGGRLYTFIQCAPCQRKFWNIKVPL